MEQKLLKMFKLADELNSKQKNIYAEIEYIADQRKRLTISIRAKEDYSYIEKCEIQLADNHILKWDNIIELFQNYVIGGVASE